MTLTDHGERDLAVLLATLSPSLRDGEFLFCTVGESSYEDYVDLVPLASFREEEGLTLVLPRHAAEEAGFVSDAVFRCISLDVHSSLQAVGLTAAIASALAQRGISANVMAAFYHDHIFVPTDQADEAMSALLELRDTSYAAQ